MSIIDYIEKYGNYSFLEFSFTEVDNIILSSLSYLNFIDIFKIRKKIFLKDAYLEYKNKKEEKKQFLASKHAFLIFEAISSKKRYKDIMLSNYVCIKDENQQFSALSLKLTKNLVYVSFEGTDDLMSGWKEDFSLAYQFPVLAQERAVKYLNSYFTFKGSKIIVGGHSKGGNLALVASMYANFLVRNKIINIYNNDGPGLRKNEFLSKRYLKIKKKLIHIIPHYSVVGLLLYHDDNYKIIKSKHSDIRAHDFLTWEVVNSNFKQYELSDFSKIISDSVFKWTEKYDDYKKKQMIESIFQIFDELNIDSYLDLFENKRLFFEVVKEASNLDKEAKDILLDLMSLIIEQFKSYEKEKIRGILPKIKK